MLVPLHTPVFAGTEFACCLNVEHPVLQSTRSRNEGAEIRDDQRLVVQTVSDTGTERDYESVAWVCSRMEMLTAWTAGGLFALQVSW